MLFHHKSSSEDTREAIYQFFVFSVTIFSFLTEKIEHFLLKQAIFPIFWVKKPKYSAIKQ